MSLILEALRKSDAERQRSASSQRLVPAAGQQRKRSAARLTVALAAITGSIAIGWYASQQSSETEATAASIETRPLSTPAVIASPTPTQVAALPVEPDAATHDNVLPLPAQNKTVVDPAPVDSPRVDSKQLAPPITAEQPTTGALRW